MAGRPPPAGPNFKTDVHRNVTKKWAGARNVAYDGDDWGGYDDYDEDYSEEPPPPMPNTTAAGKPTGLRQRGQASVRQPETSRNFTAPPTMQPAGQVSQQIPQPAMQQTINRTGSFDYGDDKRDFSAAHPGSFQQQQNPLPQGPYAGAPATGSHPTTGNTQASHISQQSSNHSDPYQRRDFTPSAVPQPLSQREPPTAPIPDQNTGQSFPARKSSLGQSERPNLAAVLPESAEDSEAPRPLFVRPADIYKRMEAEREKERQSMDSARPSGASIDKARQVATPPTIVEAPARASYSGPTEMDAGPVLTSGTLGGLRSGYGMDGLPIREEVTNKNVDTPLLPKLDRFSGFGSDMWGSTGLSEPSELSSTAEVPQINRSEVSAVSDVPLKEQPSMGFRSAVERAFDEQGGSTLSPARQYAGGSQRSADGSEISRTDSTAGVSPIISRMSSGATAAMRAQEREDRHEASPAIAEEPTSATSEGQRQVSGTTLRAAQDTHSRQVSGDSISGYRRNMDVPSPDNSPARHPALAVSDTLQPPAEGELAVTTPVDAAAQPGARSAFQEPTAVAASSRTSSPSKGRVADLANKYDTNSRRNSGSSIASWASSRRSASPVKDAAGNGVSAYQTSDALHPPSDPARPHLPGEWVSYNTTATNDSGTSLAETKTITQNASDSAAQPEPDGTSAPDFSPSKSTKAPSGIAEAGPMAALASAGAAIAASLTQVAGNAGATGERDFASDSTTVTAPAETSERRIPGEVGNSRPVATHFHAAVTQDSAGTSAAVTPSEALSQAGPTPPPKDTPLTDTINRLSGYFPAPPAPLKGRDNITPATQSQLTRETLAPHDGDAHPSDGFESDRLNDEIEKSLTPGNADANVQSSSQLAPPSPMGLNSGARESSVLPHEYDSYWNGSEFDERSQPSRGVSGAGLPSAPVNTDGVQGRQLSDTPTGATSPRPGMLAKRFSWEADDEPAANEPASLEPSTAEKIEASKPSQEVFQEPTALAEANKREFGSSELPSPAVAPAALPILQTSFDDQSGKVGSGTLSAALADDSSMTSRNMESKKSIDASPSVYGSAIPATAIDVPPTPGKPMAGNKAAWVHPAPLKELLELQPPRARVERFNQIRTQFGNMETGLDGWLSYMIAAHPEHGNAALTAPHLTADTSSGLAGSVRNKISPAMSKFANKAGSTPYYQQYLASAASVNTQAGSSQQSKSSSGPLQDPNFAGRRPSQSKGKDLFGSIGGKATHSAKGLFAKGKQKLRAASTEKASIPPTPSIPSSYAQPAPFASSTSSTAQPKRLSRFFLRSSGQVDVSNPKSTLVADNNRPTPPDLTPAAPGEPRMEDRMMTDAESTWRDKAVPFLSPVEPVTSENLETDRSTVKLQDRVGPVSSVPSMPRDTKPTVSAQLALRPADAMLEHVSSDVDDAVTEGETSGRDSFHSAHDRTSRDIDEGMRPATGDHTTSPIFETDAEHLPSAIEMPDVADHDEHLTSPSQTEPHVIDVSARGIDADTPSPLPARRESGFVDIFTAQPVTHETSQREIHHQVTESITREIHTYDEVSRVQPILDVDVLPTKHYIASPTDGQLMEIADPGHDGPVPIELGTTRSRASSGLDPVVISQREGPSDRPGSRPFANAHDGIDRPKSSVSNRSRSRSSPAPLVEAFVPPLPSSPPRPVLVSSPSQDIAFARATTNRRPQSEYIPNSQSLSHPPLSGQQWYTPTDPTSQRYVDARRFDTEYAIPGLGPDLVLPAFDKPKNTTETSEGSPAKGKKESKVRSIYGRLRSRSRSRSRSGALDFPPSSVEEEPLPPLAGTVTTRPQSSGPSFFPMRNTMRPASGPISAKTMGNGTGYGAKTPSPTRIDPRLPSQTFAVSPDLDDLEDGRRPSMMHDPDPLPRRTLPRMTKAEEAEHRRTLRRRQPVNASDDEVKQNRRSWFGGMFSSTRPSSSSQAQAQTSFVAMNSAAAEVQRVPSHVMASEPNNSRGPSGNASTSAAAAAAAAAFKSQPERKATNKLTKAPSSRPQQPRMRSADNERAARMRPTSMYATMPGPQPAQDTYGFPQHPMARDTTSYTPIRDPTLPSLAPLTINGDEASEDIDESKIHPAHRRSLPPPNKVSFHAESAGVSSGRIASSSAALPSSTQGQRASPTGGFVAGQPPREREEYVRYMQAQGFFPDRRSPRGEGPGGTGAAAGPNPVTSKRRSPERRYGVPGFEE